MTNLKWNDKKWFKKLFYIQDFFNFNKLFPIDNFNFNIIIRIMNYMEIFDKNQYINSFIKKSLFVPF